MKRLQLLFHMHWKMRTKIDQSKCILKLQKNENNNYKNNENKSWKANEIMYMLYIEILSLVHCSK